MTTAVESVKLEDTLNRAWKDDKTGFGYRMLQKMGWKEDKGLGKNETGMAAAVKVSRREEGLGLGVAKDAAGNHGWSSTVSGFSSVLDLLNSTYGTQPIKKKKTPSIQVRIKYGKMSAAKDLSTKSSKDLAAVLGHNPISFSAPATIPEHHESSSSKKKKRKTEDASTASSDNDDERRAKKSKRKDRKEKRPQQQDEEQEVAVEEENVTRKESGEKKKRKRKKTTEE